MTSSPTGGWRSVLREGHGTFYEGGGFNDGRPDGHLVYVRLHGARFGVTGRTATTSPYNMFTPAGTAFPRAKPAR